MAILEDIRRLMPPDVQDVDYSDGMFKIGKGHPEIVLPEEAYESFVSKRELILTPSETTIFMPGYYEQYIENLARFGRMPYPHGESRICLRSLDGNLLITISGISMDFMLSHMSNLQFYELVRRYARSYVRYMGLRGSEEASSVLLTEACERIISIKVSVAEQHRFYDSKEDLRGVAEAALFHINCSTGSILNLAKSWERPYYSINRMRNRRRGEETQFPLRIYESDLIAYYQLAVSSESPVFSYIGLYKILEHFFVSATEEVLHKRVSNMIASPQFSHKHDRCLRELASLIRKFDQKTNEQQMLTTVLESYFMVDEIVDWVREYEDRNGHYYTASQEVFDETYVLDMNPDYLYSALAKRIYDIRNALVHSKEGELPRYVPFSGQEDVIARELPILLFLSESLIVKTGVDI